ncbi:MAG: amino acid-binding protein, partial [Rhodobiaceae bacterium]|nr:amino acid-binding protein [Rhodobiaceae bacterium]
VPAWPSAAVTAHILADLLGSEFGLETELRDGSTLRILADLNNGAAQIHPEVWFPNLQTAVDKYVKAGTVEVSPVDGAASQNLCVTASTATQTGIAAVTDLTDPAMAQNFDTDGDGKGEIWIGAPTWSSTIIERIRAHSYGYDRTMTLLEAPEDVAMASVDVAVSLDKPIVFYCYSPHHLFELHDIKVLGEPQHDPATWHIVLPADDANWLEDSKAGSAWDQSHFNIAFASSLASDHPDVAAFLSRVRMEPEDATMMSYAVDVDRKDPAEVATAWIVANADRIRQWRQ